MQTTRSSVSRQSWRARSKQAPPSAPKADRRCPSWLIGKSVQRRRWDDPEVEAFLQRREPVVLTGGCPLVQPLVGKWTFDYLANTFGECSSLNVHFAPIETTSFARMYGKGLGKGGCTPMSFANFVELCKSDYLEPTASSEKVSPPLRYYLQAPMIWTDADRDGANPHGLAEDSAARPLRKAPYSSTIDEDMRRLGWDWLAYARSVAACDPFDTCQMWAGHGGGSTPLHFDSISNFLAQVSGRKQVLLFSPAQTWRVYPYPVGHPMDNFAMVNVEMPDLSRFPALRRARALEAILEPGDVLWLPRYWWHYVHQLDAPSENISLNFWCGRKGTDRFMQNLRTAPAPSAEEVAVASAEAAATAEAMGRHESERERVEAADDALLEADADLAFSCLHAGRIIESAAVRLLGDDKSKGYLFLSAIAAGADARWPPNATAAISNARRIRSELIGLLGSSVAANALLRMIARDGRLSPGLAPPIEGDVVNTEKGVMTPDEEVTRWFARRGARVP